MAGSADEPGRRRSEAVGKPYSATVSRRSIPLGGCAERPEGIPVGSFLQTGSGSCRGKTRPTANRRSHRSRTGLRRTLIVGARSVVRRGRLSLAHSASRAATVRGRADQQDCQSAWGSEANRRAKRKQRSFQPRHDLLRARELGESDGRGRQAILGELAILSGMSRREFWLTSGSSHNIGQHGIGA